MIVYLFLRFVRVLKVILRIYKGFKASCKSLYGFLMVANGSVFILFLNFVFTVTVARQSCVDTSAVLLIIYAVFLCFCCFCFRMLL